MSIVKIFGNEPDFRIEKDLTPVIEYHLDLKTFIHVTKKESEEKAKQTVGSECVLTGGKVYYSHIIPKLSIVYSFKRKDKLTEEQLHEKAFTVDYIQSIIEESFNPVKLPNPQEVEFSRTFL